MRFCQSKGLLAICILSLLCLSPEPGLSQQQSNGSQQDASTLTQKDIGSLEPLWSAGIKATVPEDAQQMGSNFGLALTEKRAIVLYCTRSETRNCPTGHLVSYDLKSGKRQRSIEWDRANSLESPYLYGNGSKGVFVYDLNQFFEYDEDLRLTHSLSLPKGMGLAPKPSFGYGRWATQLGRDCRINDVSRFDLNSKSVLVTGCGAAVGVIDQNGGVLFAERSSATPAWVSAFSEDGNRFVVERINVVIEPPLREHRGFSLYDLYEGHARELSFEILPQKNMRYAPLTSALTPSGELLAVIDDGALRVYRLPDR